MKSDISRQTFDPRKHYKSVRMQQGRVQVDADWNEESDLTIYRTETEALDLIGGCGGPMQAAAFEIILDPNAIAAADRNRPRARPLAKDDFLLSAGRYYVDGILCENDLVVLFSNQPDYPTLANEPHRQPVAGNARAAYLAYLDVWQRSITAIDDPQIREVALGGPDTATRLKTVWQVKLFPLANENCVTGFKKLLTDNPQSSGTLSAKTESEAISPDPCIVPPGAGFRGLENQLYRVEIHNGGTSFDVVKGGGADTVPRAVTAIVDDTGETQVKTTGPWRKDQAVEIFSGDAPTNIKSRTLAFVTGVTGDANAATLSLNTKVTNITMENHPQIRAVNATFKWSRDNGSVVVAIEGIEGKEVKVSHTGLDSVLGFAPGQWVEIIDDALELNGRPGQLAQIDKVDSSGRVITLKTDPTVLSPVADVAKSIFHPKLRRWDGIGAVDADATSTTTGYIDLEVGVQVRFGEGKYNTGDYWTIPARTATTDAQSGKIEWPQDTTNNPLALSPFGIRHHYCPLGLLSFTNAAGFVLVDDCRHLFPPVTELTSLFYVSGDGQEGMPDLLQPAALIPLRRSLVVGVSNGSWPVKGATVHFQIENGNGRVLPKDERNDKPGDTLTDDKGLATCDWQIDPTTQSQQVRATLLDADGKPVHLPVIFTANLSVADQVSYNPGGCATLQKQVTVQKALDTLSHLPSLYYFSGDGQEVLPGAALNPMEVLVANRCGPIPNVEVKFEIKSGTGTITPLSASRTDADGIARCDWTITSHRLEVEAALIDDPAQPTTAAPTKMRFSATLSTANQVSYVPDDDCPDLADAKTVQAAIDILCQRETKSGGGCAITVGEGGQFPTLDAAVKSVLDVPQELRNVDACFCLLPGDHVLEDGLAMNGAGNKVHVKIEGCGQGSRIIIRKNAVAATGLVSFILRDVAVFAAEEGTFFNFNVCDEITIEGCFLTQERQSNPFIVIANARNVQIEDNFIEAFLPVSRDAITPDKIFADVGEPIATLFTIADRTEFERKSVGVATRLAGLADRARTTLVTRVRKAFDNLQNLTPDEARSFSGFLRALTAATPNEQLIRERLVDIKDSTARGMPGIAIVLRDAEANSWIENNNITGTINLYGVAGQQKLTEDEMKRLGPPLKEGKFTIANSLSSLHVRNNTVYRIEVSEDLIKALKTIAANQGDPNPIQGLFRRCFISDNAIGDGGNSFVMDHLSLTSNTFDNDGALEDVGNIIANAAFYVGNYGPNGDIHLFVAARVRQGAANLVFPILEV